MMMVRWNPFAELAAIERRTPRLFSEVFGTLAADGAAEEPAFARLPVNVEVADGKYVITAPLAGFKPEDVEVTVEDGVLTISAKRSEEKKTERKGYVRQEVVSANLYRQIAVGEVDPSSVEAKLENGVLTINVPAPAKPEPVKIAVEGTSTAKTLPEGRAEQPAAQSA